MDEERLDAAKQRQLVFESRETKKLLEQIEDLTATLQINKALMNQVFASNANSEDAGEQLRQLSDQIRLLNDENQYLSKRNKTMHKDMEELNGRILLND